MAEPYTILAPLYDAIGMAGFAHDMLPAMLDYAQRNDWVGRSILELGCGTGAGIVTLADTGYALTGIDISPEMLAVASTKSSGVAWQNGDIRQLSNAVGQQDLILAIDVMNELEDIREIQSVFEGVHDRLKPGKPFIFDAHTLAGLHQRGTAGNQVIHDEQGIAVFASNRYDYERQVANRSYIAFERDEAGTWNRLDAVRTMRGYSLLALVPLLQKRVGFSQVMVLTTNFQPYDPRYMQVNRVVIAATK